MNNIVNIYPEVSGNSVQHINNSGGVSSVNSFLEGLADKLVKEKWGEDKYILVPEMFKNAQISTVSEIDAETTPLQVITLMLKSIQQ